MSESLHGIPASSGIAFGKAYKLIEPDLSFAQQSIENVDAELSRFHEAVFKAKQELEKIRFKVANDQGEDNATIFDAHLLALHDPELIALIENKVNDEKVNAESALTETTNWFIDSFEQIENEYMRERSIDLKDVSKRILAHLLGKSLPNLSFITEDTIVITTELTPSNIAQINQNYIKGFVTDIGGSTSHSAIMAKSLNIPVIVGTKKISTTVKQDDLLIVDGINGEVFINPTEEIQLHYLSRKARLQTKKAEWALLKNEATVTKDGHHVKLAANIDSPQAIETVIANGAEGVGLFRTEFLFMEGDALPTEEEQFLAYKTVLQAGNGQSVVVRTLDIGGDKILPYWKFPEEKNPFLGLRAIRLALKEGDIFRTQLRALLRASRYGNLKIMFPMIATLDELRKAKKILQEEKQKLIAEKIHISNEIEIGIMVEVPSTAILASTFAKEVDFFSIGTNDLIQYTFAADRLNENVAYLYQPYHPAILQLVKIVIDAAHQEGKWAAMCGEMAGDSGAIPLLIGLGLDEFSMDASSVLQARGQIKQLNKHEMSQLASKALQLSTAEEVKELVDIDLTI